MFLGILESICEYYSIIQHLFKIGIVDVIPEEDIFQVDGIKVLNGMFAVPKKGDVPEGVEKVVRLIMNFVPGNSYQKLLGSSLYYVQILGSILDQKLII